MTLNSDWRRLWKALQFRNNVDVRGIQKSCCVESAGRLNYSIGSMFNSRVIILPILSASTVISTSNARVIFTVFRQRSHINNILSYSWFDFAVTRKVIVDCVTQTTGEWSVITFGSSVTITIFPNVRVHLCGELFNRCSILNGVDSKYWTAVKTSAKLSSSSTIVWPCVNIQWKWIISVVACAKSLPRAE